MTVEPRIGRMVMYCGNCEHNFVTSEGTFRGECPKCCMPLMIRRCTRCGHTWRSKRVFYIAKVCPRCKSPYWNRERVR